MGRRRLLWLTFLLFVGLAVPVLLGGYESLRLLSGVCLQQYIFLAALMVIACLLEMLRGWILLKRYLIGMTVTRAVAIYFLVMLASCLTPYGVLAPLMLTFLLQEHDIKPRLVIATLLVTTLLDAASVIFWVLVALAVEALLSSRSLVPQQVVYGFIVLVLCALAGFAFFLRYTAWWLRTIAATAAASGLKPAYRRRIVRRLLRLRRTVTALVDLPTIDRVLLFAVSLAFWGIFLSLMFASARAIGLAVPWNQMVLLQLVATLAGHMAGLPGGMVSSEAAGVLLLVPLVGTASAVAVVLLWRLFSFHFYIIAGLAVLPLASRYFGGNFPLVGPGHRFQGRE